MVRFPWWHQLCVAVTFVDMLQWWLQPSVRRFFYWLKPDIRLSVPLFKMLPDEVSLAHLWLEISFTNKQGWSECTPSWTSYAVFYVHSNTEKKKSGQSILKSIFLKWRGIATLRDDLNFSALEYCVLARNKIYPPKMFWLTSNHQQPFHSSRIACSSYCFNGYLPNWNLLCGLQIQKKVLLVFACVDKPLFFLRDPLFLMGIYKA